ncbi:MAG: hypothetical protein KKD39_05010 [Candidatus Altiarchaeota archaeon]|nr:hypothetical protein [Candidatus Altiarchaeota archaeon]
MKDCSELMTAGERKKLRQHAKEDAEMKANAEKRKNEKRENIPDRIMKRLDRMEELVGNNKNSRKKQLLEKIAEKYKDY